MARYHLKVYLLGLYMIYLTHGATQAYYHLVSEDPACHVKQNRTQSLDLVCQWFDLPDQSCVDTQIAWTKVSSVNSHIQDSSKYGIWNTVPGKGLPDNEHVSLLRIRDFDIEDIGRYQCEIHCQKRDSSFKHSYYADVCLQTDNDKHAICGTQEPECISSFWNGVCDPACDNEQNLYDGFDCAEKVKPCPHMFEEYCQKAYTNHVCNKDCDSAECGWDGGDCLPSDKQNSYMEQVVVLVIKNSLGHQRLDLSSLGKRISQLFGSESVIQVHPDNWFSNLTSVPGFDQSEGKDINSPVLKLYLKILNNHCQSRCFTKGQYAARFLEAAIQNGWDPGIQLVQVGVLGEVSSSCKLENNTLLGIHSLPDENLPLIHPAGLLSKTHTHVVGVHWLVIVLMVCVGTVLILIATVVVVVRKHRLELHVINSQKYSYTDGIIPLLRETNIAKV